MTELFGQGVGILQIRWQGDGLGGALATQFNAHWLQVWLTGFRVEGGFQVCTRTLHDVPDTWIMLQREVTRQSAYTRFVGLSQFAPVTAGGDCDSIRQVQGTAQRLKISTFCR